jgi:hypothetical protein
MARKPHAEAEGRQRGAWVLVAFALLLCGSAIAPLGGLDAWLHSHGSIGWHVHVDDGDSRGSQAHSLAIHDHGEHAESSVGHAPPAERSAARASGHALLHDHPASEQSGDGDNEPRGMSVDLPQLLLASNRAHGSGDLVRDLDAPRGVPRPVLGWHARPVALDTARPACRTSPPRVRHRSGIALVVIRSHAILV